jgi:HD-GYP domain-containing protein (c-di-GMP phosphodiesterase class II)
MLASAAEGRTPQAGGHAERCGRLCRLLATELGLSIEEQDRAELAGLLHDIGTAAVPDAVRGKPGPLEADERALLRQHAALGAQMVGRVEHLAPIAPAVRAHHERWDGSGYPDGLAGEAIPLLARIAAVADAFDALTTERSYRPAQPWTRAAAVIAAGRATQFAPVVVDALLALARRGALA